MTPQEHAENSAGLTAEELSAWVAAGFDPEQAAEWAAFGFSPEEARRWRRVARHTAETVISAAGAWQKAGFEPE